MTIKACLKHGTLALAACLLALPMAYGADSNDEEAIEAKSQAFIYEMKEGEALKDVAVRFMGGEQYLRELMNYNRIENPLAVGKGYQVGIPGHERKEAIEAVALCEASVATAINADANTYANAELKLAQETLKATVTAKEQGAYTKAIGLARLTVARAKRAKEVADKTAPVQQPAKVTSVLGEVNVSSDEGSTWRGVNVNDQLQQYDLLKTGLNSRAEVKLADGSIIQVHANSKFQVTNFLYDRRDGKRNSALKVLAGGILGKIAKKKKEESTFDLDTDNANLAIRGTELRVDTRSHRTTRVSLLQGDVKTANAEDQSVELLTEQGTVIKKSKAPTKPIDLLPPPHMEWPQASDIQSAKQLYIFEWFPVEHKRLRNYHIELAEDDKFNKIISEGYSRSPRYYSGLLKEGTYYWRVSSVDTAGLEGVAREGKLQIKKHMDVKFTTDVDHVVVDDRWVFGAKNAIQLVPAREDSSVLIVEFQVDNEPARKMYDEIVMRNEGVFKLQGYGIGGEGDRGNVATQTVEVDMTPPVAQANLNVLKKEGTRKREVEVALTADDRNGVDRIEYRLVGDHHFKTYEGPVTIKVKKQATLQFRAVDVVGNESEINSVEL